ncbi:MAG: LemA family protein, partial [Verrucomicrobia bacterium]|nr:LemA family protein [Deltaproteobacteria bacterium]
MKRPLTLFPLSLLLLLLSLLSGCGYNTMQANE